MRRAAVYELIARERIRQRAMWAADHQWGRGDCSALTVADRARPDQVAHLLRMTVLTEEVGEVARAVIEDDADQLRTELVQVAAICVAWMESLTCPRSDAVAGLEAL